MGVIERLASVLMQACADWIGAMSWNSSFKKIADGVKNVVDKVVDTVVNIAESTVNIVSNIGNGFKNVIRDTRRFLGKNWILVTMVAVTLAIVTTNPYWLILVFPPTQTPTPQSTAYVRPAKTFTPILLRSNTPTPPKNKTATKSPTATPTGTRTYVPTETWTFTYTPTPTVAAWINPVDSGVITKHLGENNGGINSCHPEHDGVDIYVEGANTTFIEVKAVADGRIIAMGVNDSAGYFIFIFHPSVNIRV